MKCVTTGSHPKTKPGEPRRKRVQYWSADSGRSVAAILVDSGAWPGLWVVYPGTTGYLMHEKIECVTLGQMNQIREALQ
jgi:hypothetical protein